MRTLLLADDNITVQRVIALTFAGEPIQVVAVADGQQAMEKMAAHQPDIVLAGTTLPNVNGYDLARFMRSKTELQMVPVLLLAGAFENVDEARLASSGANGILEKPVEPTTLINRVKELLGLKSEEKPAPMGRLVTPGAGPADRTRPMATPPRAVAPAPATPSQDVTAKQDPPREKPGLASGPPSVADSSSRPGDYLATLDAAFDSLDQQFSGGAPAAKTPRNPAGPLGQGTGAPDPRSPGRAPSPASSATGNPVFEVDDEWFAEDNKARARQALEREQLAKEMGVHDIELPVAAKPQEPPSAIQPGPPASIAPIAPIPQVSEAFETLLAAERVERQQAPPPEIKFVAPEVTDEMLDQIASRVVDRLTTGAFGEALKEAVASTLRETARSIVAETSERLIRDSAPGVVAETSERIVRDTAHKVVAEASERMVRDTVHTVVSETSERIVRDTVHTVATEAAERAVRDTVHAVVAEASERALRDAVPAVVAETSERLVREAMPAVIAETSERMVRDTVAGVVVEASERLIGDAVPKAVSETSDRLVREAVPAAVADASERVVRENLRNVVLETSERLVREEIERIKSKATA